LREAVSDTSELETQLTEAETEMALLAEMVQEAVSENAHKAQDQNAYAEKYNGLVSRYDEQKKLHDELSDRIAAVKANDKQMEEFIQELQNLDGVVSEFDENLWSSLVDHVTVMKDKKVIFTFKGGTEITV
jgi:site-specific DNA recombinase